MINLRYHIVSITAVFLALGIGLTLGSTFLDRVTVDTLKSQLDTVQQRVDNTEAENHRLQVAVDSLTERDGGMSAELAERVVAGALTDVPVLLVATAGTDEDLITRTADVLSGAGADLGGTWWLTDRWGLDDADEVADLGAVLEVSSEDPERLRRNGAIHLADVVLDATEAVDTSAAATAPPEGETPAAGQPEPPVVAPAEPDIAAQLEEIGFLDYTAAPGATGDRVLLPAAGLRVVIVSSTPPGTGAELLSLALVDELTADGPAPIVAAQGDVELPTDSGEPAPEADRRTSFVGPLRVGELTRDRLTTIDTLDTTAGLLALVLAVEDCGDLRLGHYGVATGASRLLPGTDPDT